MISTNKLLNDRYQIIHGLANGGFSQTFLAADTHIPSRRFCVVKSLRPLQDSPQVNLLVQERFHREAAILEKLGNDHHQIPALYAYFYSETDRQFYLVQEWIDGYTLGNIVRQQEKLDETEVRRILIALLPVFEYIHCREIIHRDVKPENIILRHSDRQPVVIDFGAVRETMGVAQDSQGQPTLSIIVGTPGYMASEQSVGRPVYSSDLYSLGLTAIYLLTGQQPQGLIANPTTSEIIWRSSAPQVSPDLADILDKAIAFHPRDRYQTAGEFLAALQGTAVRTAAVYVIPADIDRQPEQPMAITSIGVDRFCEQPIYEQPTFIPPVDFDRLSEQPTVVTAIDNADNRPSAPTDIDRPSEQPTVVAPADIDKSNISEQVTVITPTDIDKFCEQITAAVDKRNRYMSLFGGLVAGGVVFNAAIAALFIINLTPPVVTVSPSASPSISPAAIIPSSVAIPASALPVIIPTPETVIPMPMPTASLSPEPSPSKKSVSIPSVTHLTSSSSSVIPTPAAPAIVIPIPKTSLSAQPFPSQKSDSPINVLSKLKNCKKAHAADGNTTHQWKYSKFLDKDGIAWVACEKKPH